MQAIYVYVLQPPFATSILAYLVRKMCELRKVSSPRPLLLLTAYAAVWWPDVTCDIRRNMDPLVIQQYLGFWGPQHKLRAVGGPKTPYLGFLEDKISMGFFDFWLTAHKRLKQH